MEALAAVLFFAIGMILLKGRTPFVLEVFAVICFAQAAYWLFQFIRRWR